MIYYTIEDRTKHKHLVYVSNKIINDPLTGTVQNIIIGKTSEEEGHTHEISTDENGEVMILPAGKKAHTHKIDFEKQIGSKEENDEVDEMFIDKDDSQIVSTCRKLYDDAYAYEENSRKKAEESERFYKGDQWEDEDIAKLNAEDRVALTINELGAKCDYLMGQQAQSFTDIRFFPIESGDSDVALVLTEVVKNITDANNMNRVESEVFQDEVVVGRGIYNIYVDYNKNPLGSIVIEKTNWRDVYYAPHEKFDLSDCDYLVKVKMYPKNKLIRMYPHKAEEIKTMVNSANVLETVKYNREYVKKAPGQLDENILNNNLNDVDAKKESLKVYELWYKEYNEKYTVADYDNGNIEEYSNLSKGIISKLEKLGLSVIRRVITSMRIIKYTGNILLENETDDTTNFSSIPVYAKKIGSDFYGKVEQVKDVQREINRRCSTSIDVINKMSSYVYFYDNNTFADQRDEQLFRENSSKPGAVFKVNSVANRPQKETGINVPAELITMQNLASQKMNLIMSIPSEAQGFAQREISSVALIETRRSTYQSNEYLFSNLADAKKQLARIIIGMIQKVYTPERVARLVLPKDPPQTEEQSMNLQRKMKAIEDIFNTPDLRDYDVAVELSPKAPTIRSAQLAFSMELLKNGFPIPPDIMIGMSDLPEKDSIIARITGQQQQTAQQEQAKIDSEIQKTKIAADSKLQAAQMKQGMNPQQMQQGMM